MKPLIAAVAALLLAACASAPPVPGPSQPQNPPPSQTASAAEPIVVAPKDIAAAPNIPVPAGGKASSDADVAANGAVPPLPQETLDQQAIAVGGLGGQLVYARQAAPKARFSPAQAVASALAEAAHQTADWQGRCEGLAGSFVWGINSNGQASARSAFYSLPHRHQLVKWTDPPAGAVVRWPDAPYGHAALSVGGGKVATTDFCRIGAVCVVPTRQLSAKWFRGEKPSWFDPTTFPYGTGGSNGAAAPIVTADANSRPGFPIRPGDVTARITRLKARFGWPGTSPRYGPSFAARIRQWERNHSRLADGVISQTEYRQILQ